MKVLIVGSDSVHVQRFIESMEHDDKHEFCFLTEYPVSWFQHREKAIAFRSKNPIKLLKAYFSIKKYIKELNPDVIHCHQLNRFTYVVSQIVKNKKNLIATAWGSDVLLIPQKSWIHRYMSVSMLKNAKIVTADAHYMIHVMKKLYAKTDYRYWQYGITPIKPAPQKEKIIFSNRLHNPLYRIHQIILYFNEFHTTHSDWKLVIGATGTETEWLKQQVANLNLADSVQFVGWLTQEENAVWYAKSAIYISIPSSDGASVSLMEAISAACIPIVSDLDANSEFITHELNGIIETKGKNPLEEALKLSIEQVKENNKDLTAAFDRRLTNQTMRDWYEEIE